MTTKQPTTAQHWLACMPVLPLERGVPVLDFGINPSWPNPGMVLYARQPGEVFNEASAGVVWDDDPGVPYECRASLLRVDLSCPQGMAYALRYACLSCWRDGYMIRAPGDLPRLIRMWGQGTVTDADRVALARALAVASR